MITTKSLLAASLALVLVACGTEQAPAPSPTEGMATPDPTQTALPGESRFPQSFRALGTEPFWAIHVSEGKLRYMTPEDQEGRQIDVIREQTESNELALSGELDGDDLMLSVTQEPCSDGMSDRSYPFASTLRLGTETFHGCARPTEP